MSGVKSVTVNLGGCRHLSSNCSFFYFFYEDLFTSQINQKKKVIIIYSQFDLTTFIDSSCWILGSEAQTVMSSA